MKHNTSKSVYSSWLVLLRLYKLLHKVFCGSGGALRKEVTAVTIVISSELAQFGIIEMEKYAIDCIMGILGSSVFEAPYSGLKAGYV